MSSFVLGLQSYGKTREKANFFTHFLSFIGGVFALFRVQVTSPKEKLRKKLVKVKRFWKINAIQPKIKAKRGRMKKFNMGQKAKWGGLVKELGF